MVMKTSGERAGTLNDEYVGIVENYRRGPKSQRNRECLVKALDLESNGPSLIGWKVGWPHDRPRLFGTILKTLGTTGTLRVKFRKGLPGQALGTIVKIVREWSK
jgi:large subunit ribosomal protein L35Ae